MNNLQTLSITYKKDQYTLWQIFGIWQAAGAPMWLLGWVAYPALSAGLPPVDASLLRIKLLTAGLIWQFVLAMVILYREEGDIRWAQFAAVFGLTIQFPREPERKRKPFGGGSFLCSC